MPTVFAQGRSMQCDAGANLRQVLLANGIDLYNGQSSLINCRGLGTCGTCAVQIVGDVSEANWKDRTRRSLPPHRPDRDLRLACQTQVLGDITLIKYNGFWGQGDQRVW